MALRQKRIIFVICPEPTDHGAGCSDAHAAFCVALYFFLFLFDYGGTMLFFEVPRYYDSLESRSLFLVR